MSYAISQYDAPPELPPCDYPGQIQVIDLDTGETSCQCPAGQVLQGGRCSAPSSSGGSTAKAGSDIGVVAFALLASVAIVWYAVR